MANTNEVVLVGDVSGIQGSISDVATRIRDRMHARSFEIGRTLVALVQDKTPVLTGALQFSISYDDSLTGDDLVWIYADDATQEDAWNRVYVAYQEGPPMGLYTYTNPPRSMFLNTADGDGFDAAQTWATDVANEMTGSLFP